MVKVEELAADMRPAEGELHGARRPLVAQPSEPRIAVDLQRTGELGEVALQVHTLAVLAIEISDCRGQRPCPGRSSRAYNHSRPVLVRPRGDDVEHLGDVLANGVRGAAAARAAFVLDIDDDLDPRQMRRQCTAVELRRLVLAGRLLAVGGSLATPA